MTRWLWCYAKKSHAGVQCYENCDVLLLTTSTTTNKDDNDFDVDKNWTRKALLSFFVLTDHCDWLLPRWTVFLTTWNSLFTFYMNVKHFLQDDPLDSIKAARVSMSGRPYTAIIDVDKALGSLRNIRWLIHCGLSGLLCSLIDWSIVCLAWYLLTLSSWKSTLLIHWLISWLVDWLTDWLTCWLIDWLIGWLANLLIDWLSHGMTDFLRDHWLIF